MVLLFIGSGLGSEKQLTEEAREAIARSEIIFIDNYTGYLESGLISSLQKSGRDVRIADRDMLESGASKIVEFAREKNVTLIVPGDPFIATTHQAIRHEALQKGVKCRTIHGVSIISAAISESGLHLYKFGRTITIPKTEDITQLTQPYIAIKENMSLGLHTLVLLDTRSGGLTSSEALTALMEAEEYFKAGVISKDLLVISLARLGWDDLKIVAGRLVEILEYQLPPPPHTLIIPGELHFTERESIKTYSLAPSYVEAYIPPNRVRERVEKYAQKCRKIIDSMKAGEIEEDYLEIVRSYVDDGLNFLNQRDISNSLLAIGYAEGLLDALRLRGLVNFQW